MNPGHSEKLLPFLPGTQCEPWLQTSLKLGMDHTFYIFLHSLEVQKPAVLLKVFCWKDHCFLKDLNKNSSTFVFSGIESPGHRI